MHWVVVPLLNHISKGRELLAVLIALFLIPSQLPRYLLGKGTLLKNTLSVKTIIFQSDSIKISLPEKINSEGAHTKNSL